MRVKCFNFVLFVILGLLCLRLVFLLFVSWPSQSLVAEYKELVRYNKSLQTENLDLVEKLFQVNAHADIWQQHMRYYKSYKANNEALYIVKNW